MLIHSKAKQNAAVGESVHRPDPHDDMTKIFEASMVLRKSIEQAKKDPWFSTEHWKTLQKM